jgi:hypothetical protein
VAWRSSVDWWLGRTLHRFLAAAGFHHSLVHSDDEWRTCCAVLNETLADNLDEAPDESAAEPKDRSTVSSAGDLQLVQWTFVEWSSNMSSGCTLILAANTIVYTLSIALSRSAADICWDIIIFCYPSVNRSLGRFHRQTSSRAWCDLLYTLNFRWRRSHFCINPKIEIFCSGYTGYTGWSAIDSRLAWSACKWRVNRKTGFFDSYTFIYF